ncbi:hypothetical protein [Gluconacetobacter asukensis]|uniref:Uncharacterized protein n=1 Tax=Gluconacetobacter asukensis TaxID=1017181 RepID=A0A7W4J3S5_9PROT|nr:hypothetical protein [Gluconacetobacter asukensis]MBB2174185.1 hypothetical protein [Gluconacetobacter asukensis]
MDIHALPPEIAVIDRSGIDEWTVVWSDFSANPCSMRRTKIKRLVRIP